MKFLTAFLIITSLAFTSFAKDAPEEDSFKDAAAKLLVDKAQLIKLEGDVSPNESFIEVKENMINFISNVFDSLSFFGSDEEDELPTNIDNIEYDCANNKDCFLKLKLKNGQTVTYSYEVKVNHKQEPTEIKNNKVLVNKN